MVATPSFFYDETTKDRQRSPNETKLGKKQRVAEKTVVLLTEDIEECIHRLLCGYEFLGGIDEKTPKMSSRLLDSGPRDEGAGFLTEFWRKNLRAANIAIGKYVCCNADEENLKYLHDRSYWKVTRMF